MKLEDTSFSAIKSDVGAGKSTLAKLFSGRLTPTTEVYISTGKISRLTTIRTR